MIIKWVGWRLLVSASGSAHQDSQDTVWDIANPARPVRLSAFQGGQPTAVSPDGRILSTITYGGQLALWDVADPGTPARIATAAPGDGDPMWGQAFSPDGRTLTVVVDRAENNPSQHNAARDTVFTWTVTDSGALGALATAFRNVKDSQPTLAPDGRTVVDGSPTSGLVYLWKPAGERSLTTNPWRMNTTTSTTNGETAADTTWSNACTGS